MLTPINGSNPPTQDVSTIRRIMEERRIFDSATFLPLQEAIRKIWSDIENLYRLHREDGGKGPGGGGGSATSPVTIKKQIIVYPLCNIVNENMAVGYNEYTEVFESSTSIRWALHPGRHDARYFQPIGNDCQIQYIMGTLWFQPKEGGSVIPAQQHFIRMNLFQGSPDLSGRNLLGFDFGFERFGHPLDSSSRGKFFLDVFEFPQETTQTPPTLLQDEISVSSRKYYSESPILDDTLLSDYHDHGLWCRLNLTVFVT